MRLFYTRCTLRETRYGIRAGAALQTLKKNAIHCAYPRLCGIHSSLERWCHGETEDGRDREAVKAFRVVFCAFQRENLRRLQWRTSTSPAWRRGGLAQRDGSHKTKHQRPLNASSQVVRRAPVAVQRYRPGVFVEWYASTLARSGMRSETLVSSETTVEEHFESCFAFR